MILHKRPQRNNGAAQLLPRRVCVRPRLPRCLVSLGLHDQQSSRIITWICNKCFFWLAHEQ